MIKKYSKQSLLFNSQDFEVYMNEIDRRLIAKDVKIQNRPIMAWSEISKDLNCAISLRDEFSIKISDWYKTRYGNRLLMSFEIGKMVVLICNNPFLIRFPVIYGAPPVNPLNFIQEITPDLLNSLVKDDLDYLANFIIKNYKSFNLISEHRFISISDIDIAVSQIMNQSPDYGLSKWASLQVAEKALKTYISRKNCNYQNTHSLSKLLSQAETLGLDNITDSLINQIQCSPSVRYGEEKVSLIEAVEAHQSSIELCKLIAQRFDMK